MGSQRLLCLGRGCQGIGGGREGDEAAVSGRVDLAATVGGNSGAEQPLVFGARLSVACGAELLEQAGRALDVCEEEGDCAAEERRGSGLVLSDGWWTGSAQRRGRSPLRTPRRRLEDGALLPSEAQRGDQQGDGVFAG